jgi:lipoprotein-releasing system ATP-binding protein
VDHSLRSSDHRPASLEVSSLRKNFERAGERDEVRVLEGISFKLQAGESMAITGPSGSGKSTLLHIIGTLEPPGDGYIEIDGKDPFSMREGALARYRNLGIGFVFQNHQLLPQYSVLENVLMPVLAFARIDAEARARGLGLLDRVGLHERAHHAPAELSGGECQRVAVARALMNRPGLLLCDEPTGNLDRSTAEVVAELLFGLHRAEKNMLIVVTHSMEIAARCGRRLELRDGQCFEV